MRGDHSNRSCSRRRSIRYGAAALATVLAPTAGAGTAVAAAPSSPRSLAVPSVTDSSATLSWQPPADPGDGVDHYVVTVEGERDHTVGAGTTTTTVTALDYDTEYTFGVRAVTAAGDASPVATVTAWTASAIYDPPPLPAQSLTVTARGPESVALEWTAVETLQTDHEGWLVTLDGAERRTVEASTRSVTLSGLSPGTTYRVGVVAMDDTYRSDGLERTVRTAPPALPDGTVPRDVDGDGTYEDLNGNGEFDSDDVVRYFQYIDDPAIQRNPTYYDANGNGNADFADVVTLFQRL